MQIHENIGLGSLLQSYVRQAGVLGLEEARSQAVEKLVRRIDWLLYQERTEGSSEDVQGHLLRVCLAAHLLAGDKWRQHFTGAARPIALDEPGVREADEIAMALRSVLLECLDCAPCDLPVRHGDGGRPRFTFCDLHEVLKAAERYRGLPFSMCAMFPGLADFCGEACAASRRPATSAPFDVPIGRLLN